MKLLILRKLIREARDYANQFAMTGNCIGLVLASEKVGQALNEALYDTRLWVEDDEIKRCVIELQWIQSTIEEIAEYCEYNSSKN